MEMAAEQIKILLVEDEIVNNEGAFKIANAYKFDGKLKFEFKPKSQDVEFEFLQQYALVIVDITLAKKSEMDGYGVVKKILEENLYPKEKLIILTGNNKVEEGLLERGIDANGIMIEYKPINYEGVAEFLSKKLPPDFWQDNSDEEQL